MIARLFLILLFTPVLMGLSTPKPVPLRDLSVAAAVGIKQALAFRPVLGTVDSLAWVGAHDSITGIDLLDSQKPYLGEFAGVGFPDIRTYLPPRSRFAEPGPWAPLVAWRTMQDAQDIAEPIAHIRCMGLSPQDVAQRADLYLDMIYGLAEKYQLNALLVKAVIAEESCFNASALSKVGAQGLMQLMPETALWLKVNDPHDPEQNLQAGIRYLASLQKEFESEELTLAAYNAGPGNVRRYKGIPPFAETQAYVLSVQSNYRRYKAAHNLLHPDVGRLESARVETLVP